MKSMILPARNFKVIALCSLFLVGLMACKGKGDGPESLISDKEKPAWAAPAEFDMSSSMTATVKVDLSLTYPKHVKNASEAVAEDDLLAAFVGNVCVGVTDSVVDGLFFLYITPPTGDEGDIKLRYYSSILKNTFISKETFLFQNDEQKGSYSKPYTPEFIVEE